MSPEFDSDHPLYRRLGRSAADRQQAYRELFRAKLSSDFIEALRQATNGGWALGDERFQRQIAKMARRRATKLPKAAHPPSTATSGSLVYSDPISFKLVALDPECACWRDRCLYRIDCTVLGCAQALEPP